MIYAQHFSQEEFREWSDDMSPRLVTMLDVLRFKLGSPIEISASEYALGRNLGVGKMSEHNIDEWGEVLAVDCFIRASTVSSKLRPWCMKLRGLALLASGSTRTPVTTKAKSRSCFTLACGPIS